MTTRSAGSPASGSARELGPELLPAATPREKQRDPDAGHGAEEHANHEVTGDEQRDGQRRRQSDQDPAQRHRSHTYSGAPLCEGRVKQPRALHQRINRDGRATRLFTLV